MTMQLIQTQTLGSSAASIVFSSIPQNFTDLMLVCSVRGNSGTGEYIVGSFNSNTTGYVARVLSGSGSGSGATSTFTTGAASRIFTYAVGNDATANTFCNSQVYIPNYAGSVNKCYSSEGVMENNATLSIQEILSGLWSNTAAITSITLVPFSGGAAWLAGSTISLYGITKGSGGATVS
jgi:hypothetical protein